MGVNFELLAPVKGTSKIEREKDLADKIDLLING